MIKEVSAVLDALETSSFGELSFEVSPEICWHEVPRLLVTGVFMSELSGSDICRFFDLGHVLVPVPEKSYTADLPRVVDRFSIRLCKSCRYEFLLSIVMKSAPSITGMIETFPDSLARKYKSISFMPCTLKNRNTQCILVS